MSTSKYRKHYIPLESNPAVFTQLIHNLGVNSALHFEDIWTLDEPTLLPTSALSIVLILPTSAAYEAQKEREDGVLDEYTGTTMSEDMIWFKQTINNACGLYAIVHAVCNGDARDFIRRSFPPSHIDILIVYRV